MQNEMDKLKQTSWVAVMVLEKWRDGNYREILRDAHGHYLKGYSQKIVERVDLTAWTPQPRFERPKARLYRATVFIDGVPVNHKYHHYGIVCIDELDNIDIDKMKEDLLEYVQNELGYDSSEWWFNYRFGVNLPEPNYTGMGKGYDYEHSIL